ncbi:MAG: hypothetical protein JJV98_03855, partial [Desulfosarcina sp.]|nr:hypothetical protein [Desulfobacterales bacterium]
MKSRFAAAVLLFLLLCTWTATAKSDDPAVIQTARVLKSGRYEAALIKRQTGPDQKNRRNLYEKFRFVDDST